MMNWIKSLTFLAVLLSAAALFGDDATNQFNTAKNAFDGKQYEPARAGFASFLERFQTHAKANEATFYLAESLMYLRQYPQAENYFSRLVALGLTDQFARAALFRVAEIPYMQGQLDIAKPRLEEFVEKLPHDINLQFVLYYLGDIAMRSNAAEEAEFYFDQTNRMFPEGARSLECKLGLAWAKNSLGKQTEANAIYSQLMNSNNPAIVEQATYQYGTALFERGMFQDAINLLTDFQRRYPTSSYFADSQRVIARCKGRLNDFEGALQILAQIANPQTDDLLMQVRCLYGLKKMQEAKAILDRTKQGAGIAYRDEIALLESAFLSDQKDWRGTIALLEQVLLPQFDPNNNRMVVNYFLLPVTSGTKKLSDVAIFRACSLLALAYANNGDSAKANALHTEMQIQAALSGNLRLTEICVSTKTQLDNVRVTPGRGGSGGSYAGGGRNDQQWNPDNQGSPSRTPSLQTSGTDLQKFWNADRLYQAKNYEAAAQQLEQILVGYYNLIAIPPLYSILYNITGAEGTLDENTFAKACSLLALSKAQLGDREQANAIMQTFASRIRMNNTVQQNLLQETHQQLAALIINGSGTTGNVASSLSDTEQRRLLREAKDAFHSGRYDQTEARLTELVATKPAEAILTEALFLQSQAKYKLGRERESIAILERIIDEFPESKEYPEALWGLGLWYESGDESFLAVEYFQKLADRFSNFKHIDGVLYFLAVDDLVNGSGRKATTNFNRIYKNNRSGQYWSHATWMLAYEAYKKKQYTQAERYIQEILRHPPDVVVLDRALYLQGELALKRNDFETALLAFREVSRLVVDSPLAVHAAKNAGFAASKVLKIN